MAHHHPQICQRALLKHVCVVCHCALLAKCALNVGFNVYFSAWHVEDAARMSYAGACAQISTVFKWFPHGTLKHTRPSCGCTYPITPRLACTGPDMWGSPKLDFSLGFGETETAKGI